jgi:kynureninase
VQSGLPSAPSCHVWLRAKSERLTAHLEALLDHHAHADVTILTPRAPQQRGAQPSLRVERHSRELLARLTRASVVCDWQAPDVIRVAPFPGQPGPPVPQCRSCDAGR